uniref:C2H2-type domain-containing protein n=1 Tax=Anas platyrhynchos TaxID=8839 RepID=A0A8B9T5B5_ANAPL
MGAWGRGRTLFPWGGGSPVPPRGFGKSRDLRKHRQTHTAARPFSCPQCGSSFRLKQILVSHQKVHGSEKPFGCADCGKSFVQKHHLQSHRRTHTGERPFPCSECGRRFRKKTHLVRHLRTHTGERPYACACCGRSFAHKQHLLRHQQLHAEPADGTALPPAEQKPFPCPECGKSFSWKKNLTSHRRLHLEGRPFASPARGAAVLRVLRRHRGQGEEPAAPTWSAQLRGPMWHRDGDKDRAAVLLPMGTVQGTR